jgi:hypothetical protein
VKAVKELLKAKQDIPPKLLDPIPDLEAIWKARQEEIKIQEALLQQQQQEHDGEVTIVVDTAGDQSLRHHEEDYIPILPIVDSDSDDTDTSVLDESGVYDSDIDYSWNRRR